MPYGMPNAPPMANTGYYYPTYWAILCSSLTFPCEFCSVFCDLTPRGCVCPASAAVVPPCHWIKPFGLSYICNSICLEPNAACIWGRL
jgi:hypothetical protein